MKRIDPTNDLTSSAVSAAPGGPAPPKSIGLQPLVNVALPSTYVACLLWVLMHSLLINHPSIIRASIDRASYGKPRMPVMDMFSAWDPSQHDAAFVWNLSQLIHGLIRGLDEQGVSIWIYPGAALVPEHKNEAPPPKPDTTDYQNQDGIKSTSALPRIPEIVDYRFLPFHEGIDMAIWSTDLSRALFAVPILEYLGYEFVDTSFGFRVFHKSGYQDPRYDYRVPFVDLLVVRKDAIYDGSYMVSSYCHDCSRIVVSSCTKTLCGCLVSTYAERDILPLQDARVDGVEVLVPVNRTLIEYPSDDPLIKFAIHSFL